MIYIAAPRMHIHVSHYIQTNIADKMGHFQTVWVVGTVISTDRVL